MNLSTAKRNVCVESYVLGIKHMHMQKHEHFHTFCKHFDSFVLRLPEKLFTFVHWPSFNLKLISVDIFRSCSITNQGLSRTKNKFQGLSRP